MRKFSEELNNIREQSIFKFVNDVKQQMRDAAAEGEKFLSIRIDNRDFQAAIEELVEEDEGLSIRNFNGYYTIKWEM